MVDHRRSELLEQVFIEYRYAAVLADPARLAGWEDRELTMSQLRVLFILNGDPGMTAGNLAARLAVRPSTVTGIVDRLVKQELVERGADPDDRRIVRNFLSVTGERVINGFTAAATEFIKSFLEPLSDAELVEALTGLGRINASAQALGLQPKREIPIPAMGNARVGRL